MMRRSYIRSPSQKDGQLLNSNMLAQLVDKKTINNSGILRIDTPTAESDLPHYWSGHPGAAHYLITMGKQAANDS
jgi:hypothetical protein